MRGDSVNLNFKAFNKQPSDLIVKCLEIPHYAYSQRYNQLQYSRNIFLIFLTLLHLKPTLY